MEWIKTKLRTISIFFNCKIMKSHNWTSKAQEGIEPSLIQLNAGVDGFFDYAKLYCKDCGHVYKGSFEFDK